MRRNISAPGRTDNAAPLSFPPVKSVCEPRHDHPDRRHPTHRRCSRILPA